MKKRVILLGAMMAFASAAFAATGIQSGTKYGTGQDSIDCRTNLSLFSSYAKQKNYKDAAEFWEKVYTNCPASSKNIYIYGPKIIAYQIEKAKEVKDANAQNKLFDKLMKVYDDRIKYFGNDRKMNKHQILAEKAMDYIDYCPDARDPQKGAAYEWLKQAIEAEGSKLKAAAYQKYFVLSDRFFAANKETFRQTYIDDYLKLSPLVAERIQSGDEKDSANFTLIKNSLDATFAKSGAAECSTLDKIYSSQVESKKNDKAFLNMVTRLYGIADCENSAVYFKAAAYKHAVDPTASSARGLAQQAYSKKDRSTALKYFKEAISLESDNTEKAKLQMKVATIYKELGNPSASREAARAALNYRSDMANAYILIAMLYAENTNISDDYVLKQTAFWAAVDKLEKAKAVDPSCAANVNKMINSYKQVYPDKTELFMRNLTEGASFTVPGWINEKTTVRGK